jgi:outer membrane protein insertion porin family
MRRRAASPRELLAAVAIWALAAWVLAAAIPARAQEAPGTARTPMVREILVSGTRMVEPATVRARIGSREGAPYDPEQVSKDVRALFELGSFENVTVDAEAFEGGIRLTYKVVEQIGRAHV